MATNMRHYNSPEELAKREGASAGPTVRGQGFRHYNSPDEVAKREAARGGKQAVSVVTPARSKQVVDVVPEVWPPAGQENTASVVVHDAPQLPPVANAPAEGLVERVEHLERLVFTLLDDVTQAREFRMQLSNAGAVVESQRRLVNRVRAAEQVIDQLVIRAHAEDVEGSHDTQPPAAGAEPASPVEPTT